MAGTSAKGEKKKSKKRERVEEEEEEEIYVVEKILDKRVLEDGTILYYLKWRVSTVFYTRTALYAQLLHIINLLRVM